MDSHKLNQVLGSHKLNHACDSNRLNQVLGGHTQTQKIYFSFCNWIRQDPVAEVSPIIIALSPFV